MAFALPATRLGYAGPELCVRLLGDERPRSAPWTAQPPRKAPAREHAAAFLPWS